MPLQSAPRPRWGEGCYNGARGGARLCTLPLPRGRRRGRGAARRPRAGSCKAEEPHADAARVAVSALRQGGSSLACGPRSARGGRAGRTRSVSCRSQARRLQGDSEHVVKTEPVGSHPRRGLRHTTQPIRACERNDSSFQTLGGCTRERRGGGDVETSAKGQRRTELGDFARCDASAEQAVQLGAEGVYASPGMRGHANLRRGATTGEERC